MILVLEKVKPYLGALVDLLLPPRCFHCGEDVASQGELCGGCWRELNFITHPLCRCCGLPFELEMEDEGLCGGCLRQKPIYDMARSATRFDDFSRHLVHGLKYGDKLEGAKGYAGMLLRAGGDVIEGADIIVPVPLHRKRLFQRRFNQAAIIAKALGKLTGMPIELLGLERHKPTISQVGLSRRERRKNVRNSFRIKEKYKARFIGKTILLVDDVLTTGATVEACAETLKKAGASKVHVLTLSRVVGPYQEPI